VEHLVADALGFATRPGSAATRDAIPSDGWGGKVA
jgi:hypothetical protein